MDGKADGGVQRSDLLLRESFAPQNVPELAHPVAGSDHAQIIRLRVGQDIPHAQRVVPVSAGQGAYVVGRSDAQLFQRAREVVADHAVRFRKTPGIGKIRPVVHDRDGEPHHGGKPAGGLGDVPRAEKDQPLLREESPCVFSSVHRPGQHRRSAFLDRFQDIPYLFTLHMPLLLRSRPLPLLFPHEIVPPPLSDGQAERPPASWTKKEKPQKRLFLGASGRIRTADLLITNQLRCQLRYRSEHGDYNAFLRSCQLRFSGFFPPFSPSLFPASSETPRAGRPLSGSVPA